MPNGLEGLPVKIGPFTEDALNDALDIVVTSAQSRGASAALQDHPALVARRVFSLDSCQRAALLEMTDEELQEVVRPVVRALEAASADPNVQFRALLSQQVLRESPLRVRCRIDIDTR
jgi:hypothetical protein